MPEVPMEMNNEKSPHMIQNYFRYCLDTDPSPQIIY